MTNPTSDINECDNIPNVCSDDAVCENTNGSFTCSCHAGSKLENDVVTCTGI